ncbi:hypothetical protein RFI_16640 [Reticulomyxa filosa]|uniref:PhoD-like phosphatase metallophosphatase domain-containing protein n=1 Tax=Reticulomyxa filosa TaxID=46433 RepID=X6N3T5_RETFI|nr:hypothetical protein RFI_16640 [Reticulomyxa filosa]|eukprot:ETO20578.1 hypothetical protein RFI_16640 [Reticulomyxa filosa]
MDMILSHDIGNVLLLSGDVHFGELAKAHCTRKIPKNDGGGNDEASWQYEHRHIFEVTSSGLTHTIPGEDAPFVIRNSYLLYSALESDQFKFCEMTEMNFGEMDIWYRSGENKDAIEKVQLKLLHSQTQEVWCSAWYPLNNYSYVNDRDEREGEYVVIDTEHHWKCYMQKPLLDSRRVYFDKISPFLWPRARANTNSDKKNT